MKVLLVKSAGYVAEECGAGKPDRVRLPCGILLAGAYLRRKGYAVDVVNTFNPSEVDFSPYDVVVSWIPLLEGFYSELEYLRRAKQQSRKTIMILNDPFEGLEVEVMKKYPFIDYTIRLWERELALEKLLGKIKEGRGIDAACDKGIIYRNSDGDIVDCGRMPPSENLYHLGSCAALLGEMDLSKYDEGQVETGRGCAFGCAFCFYQKSRPRKRRPEDIAEEIETLAVKGGLRFTWLHDLDIGSDKMWLSELCNLLIKKNLPIRWGSDLRIEHYSDKKFLGMLKSSGCEFLYIGLESVSEIVQSKIAKRTDPNRIKTAISNCLEAGIVPSVNLIIGFPWDDDMALEEMRRFVESTPYIDNIQFLRPLRGTTLYDEMRRMGLLTRDLSFEDYIFSRSSPICPTLYLTKEQLVGWNEKIKIAYSISRFRYDLKHRKISELISMYLGGKFLTFRRVKVLMSMVGGLFSPDKHAQKE